MTVFASQFLKMVKDGDTLVVKRATRDNRDGDAPDWSDYGGPHFIKVCVSRRTKPFKERGRYGKTHPVGELLELTIKNGSWAGHSEDDFSVDHCTFATENYYMNVIQWNGVNVVPDPKPAPPAPTRITISMDEYNRLKNLAGEK